MRQAVVRAGQHRRQHEVRIGVRPGDAMLDMAGARGTGGDAQGNGAVVDAPGQAHRRVGIGLEALIGIAAGREDGHAVGQMVLHAADHGFQQGRALRVFGGAQVFARLVRHRDVDVKAGPGAVAPRLGHEGRLDAEAERHALGGALVHHGVVGGPERVGLVPERQFDLARRKFRDRAFQWNPLRVRRLPQGAEEVAVRLDFRQAVNLRAARRLAGVESGGGD